MKKSIVIIFITAQMLFSCTERNSKNKQTEDFRTFLVEFSTNNDFQQSRIIFPLEYITLTEDLDNTQKKIINRSDWKNENIFYGKGCNEIYPQIFDNFTMKLRESGERVLAWRGIENGVAIFYYFKLIENKWFLVKKEDYST